MCTPAGASIGANLQNDYRAGTFTINVWDYNTSAAYKAVDWQGGSVADGTTTWSVGNGMWVNTAAITSITILMTTGTFKTGTIQVYGVN